MTEQNNIGFLYIFENEWYKSDNILKIGATKNIKRRINDPCYTTAFKYKFECKAFWEIYETPQCNIFAIERHIHELLNEYKIKDSCGKELYEISLSKAKEIISEYLQKKPYDYEEKNNINDATNVFTYNDKIAEQIEEKEKEIELLNNNVDNLSYLSILDYDINQIILDKKIKCDECNKPINHLYSRIKKTLM